LYGVDVQSHVLGRDIFNSGQYVEWTVAQSSKLNNRPPNASHHTFAFHQFIVLLLLQYLCPVTTPVTISPAPSAHVSVMVVSSANAMVDVSNIAHTAVIKQIACFMDLCVAGRCPLHKDDRKEERSPNEDNPTNVILAKAKIRLGDKLMPTVFCLILLFFKNFKVI